MGCIIEEHPGNDGLIRVVTLKTAEGMLKRPIVRLIKLFTSESEKDNCDQFKNKEEHRLIQQEIRRTRSTSKSQINCISLFSIIFYLLNLITLIVGTPSYEVTHLNQDSGIIFNIHGQMQIIKNH
jgi:hypothetical protein